MFFVAAMAIVSLAAMAQTPKFAYVDFNELIMLMHEMDSARATMEENQKTNEEILMAMYEEYQSKAQQYEQKQASWTPAIRDSKQKEIIDIETRLQQTQQSLQQEMQQLQNSLQAPIYEKAQKAVNDIAKAKGCTAVFEKGSLLYLDPAQMVDLTPEARTALGIPAGRTLEALQAELQAKAQTAQAAMAQ